MSLLDCLLIKNLQLLFREAMAERGRAEGINFSFVSKITAAY